MKFLKQFAGNDQSDTVNTPRNSWKALPEKM